MYKRKLSIIVLIVTAAALIAVLGIYASAEEISADGATTATSGRCGKNAFWEFDASSGALKTTGTGKVDDYSFSSSPWHGVCSQIKSVTYSSGILNIGNYSFFDCGKLTSVNLPDSLATIGKYAFYYCKSLRTITIPKGVTTINECVFESCPALAEIKVDKDNKYFTVWNGALFSANMKTVILCPPKLSATSFNIPYGVTLVGNGAFRDCARLNSISIPNSVTFIGSGAFAGCTSLKTMRILGKSAGTV